MTNGFENVRTVGQDGLNRTMESLGALSRGWQTLASETVGFSKQSFEEGASHVQKLMGAGSPDGVVQAQTEFMRASYDRTLGHAARVGELYVDLVQGAAKPFDGFVPSAAK